MSFLSFSSISRLCNAWFVRNFDRFRHVRLPIARNGDALIMARKSKHTIIYIRCAFWLSSLMGSYCYSCRFTCIPISRKRNVSEVSSNASNTPEMAPRPEKRSRRIRQPNFNVSQFIDGEVSVKARFLLRRFTLCGELFAGGGSRWSGIAVDASLERRRWNCW